MPINDDRVIQAIAEGELTADNISFDKIVGFRKNHELWRTLGRGRAVLSTTEQLDQYLYSYGRMIKSHCQGVLERIKAPTKSVQIIDYGCGQGLATAFLIDHFGVQNIDKVKKIVLIEKSPVALQRAEAVTKCYSNQIDVIGINKDLSDVTPDELQGGRSITTFHIFSNVLDIEGFNQVELFRKLVQSPGKHVICAVGHHRGSRGGTPRIQSCMAFLDEIGSLDGFKLKTNEAWSFQWDESHDSKLAVGWCAEIKVTDGSI